jgi:hypothetical protein
LTNFTIGMAGSRKKDVSNAAKSTPSNLPQCAAGANPRVFRI